MLYSFYCWRWICICLFRVLIFHCMSIWHLESAKNGISNSIVHILNWKYVGWFVEQNSLLVSIWSDSSILNISLKRFLRQLGGTKHSVFPPSNCLVNYAIISSYKMHLVDLLFELINKFLYELFEAFLNAF